MRLWHQDLINKLPRQQLLGQHRECAALRGKGWNKNHATVNYIFKYSLERLYCYHQLVMKEMKNRGYKVSAEWWELEYRGKNCERFIPNLKKVAQIKKLKKIYPEHDQNYLRECIENLSAKKVVCRYIEKLMK